MTTELIERCLHPACSAFARMLFVWVKDGQIRCFSPDEIRSGEEAWKADGWRHTATIDPARWIEAMANGNTDPSDMLDELQMGPNVAGEATASKKGTKI